MHSVYVCLCSRNSHSTIQQGLVDSAISHMTKDKGWGFWGSPKGLSHQCLIKADEAENCVSLGRTIDEDWIGLREVWQTLTRLLGAVSENTCY